MNWYPAYQRLKMVAAPLLRDGVLSFDIHNLALGFFAHLNWCADILHYCDQRGLTAQMSITSPAYRDPARSANWLSYFFKLVQKTSQIDFCIAHIDELYIPHRYLANRTIEGVAELVRRHLPVKDEIAGEADRFCIKQFGGGKILGVHFRGTDKTSEAQRASADIMRETIANYLQSNGDVDALFVASDEKRFKDYMRESFPRVRFLSYASGLGPHLQDRGSGNYKKGEEALLDCLLLSRCSALVRTASFLSAWASIFNPTLPIVLVNRPYPDSFWFPETALVGRSMNEYLPAERFNRG